MIKHVFQALPARAGGFLLKAAPPGTLVQAVRTVADGEPLLDPAVTRRLVEHFLARPEPDDEMGEQLFLSPATVKSHVTRILGRLGVRSRVQAVVLAYETGLVRPGDAGP
ncbi:MAG: response regulator transcription factor [Solirubrobacteraceae bacterium]